MMFISESEKMTAFLPKDCLTFTYYLIKKEVFDRKFSLESDKMIALWPTHSLTLTFYGTFSKSILN